MESVIPGGMYVVVTQQDRDAAAAPSGSRRTVGTADGFVRGRVRRNGRQKQGYTENLSGKSASYRRLNDMLSGFANGSDSVGRPQHHLQ